MRRAQSLLVATGLFASVFVTAGTVGYYEESLPSTMNPLFARSMVDYRTHELMFDRLFFRSPITNEIETRILESYEMGADNTSLRVVVKEGIQWHDGESMGPNDICFTVAAMLDPGTASPVVKPFREAIKGCEYNNRDRSATITLNKPYHDPYDRLGFSVLPEHAFPGTAVSPDLDFSHRPIGSGPMRGSKGTRGVRFTAVPNGHHNARIEVMNLQPGGDAFVQIRTLMANGVQGVVTVPPALRPEVQASDDVALKSYDLRSWWFIAVNTTRGPLQNKKIRQALDYSIDRSELREFTIGYDANDPSPPCEFISGPFVQSSPYYNRAIPPRETADRAKAEQLMTEAGAVKTAGVWVYQGNPITFQIGLNAPLDTEARDILNQVGNQIQGASFNQQVRRVDADAWATEAVTGQLTNDYDLLIGKWSFGLVEDVNSLFHTRTRDGKGGLNIFNYSNPEVDAILTRYENARTDTQAQDAYHDLHEKLAEELPYIFLWKLDTKTAWRNEVHGNTIAPYFYFTAFDGWRYDG